MANSPTILDADALTPLQLHLADTAITYARATGSRGATYGEEGPGGSNRVEVTVEHAGDNTWRVL